MTESQHSGEFQAEVNSGFEPILIAKVFEPILARMPESIAPNAISVFGHASCWATFGCAYLSTGLQGWPKALALVGAGILTFVTMAADCLDGMQARRTGRTSKLGELLDHWLDAIHVPMTTAGLVLVVGLEPWLAVAVHVSATAIYNAQLVLYQRSGRFVHPPTSGVDGAFGTAIGYLLLAVYLGAFGANPWVDRILGIVAVFVQLRLNAFYYRRLGRWIGAHLLFIALALGFSGAFLAGLTSRLVFVLLIVFLSFRLNGRWVWASLLKRPFSGFDWPCALCVVAIPLVHLLPPWIVHETDLRTLVPHAAIGLLVALNLLDFRRDYPKLVGGAT